MKQILKMISLLFMMIFITWNAGCSDEMTKRGQEDEMAEREREAERMMRTNGVQRNYVFSLHEDSLILIDGFFLKPGGVLYDIAKNEFGWQLLEKIDLNPILGEFSPKNVVFNDHWLCINTVPKNPRDLEKLFFFQKQNDGWNYVEFPETMTREEVWGSFAFYEKDFFLCGQGYDPDPTGRGKIYFYDLTHHPPRLIQTILPERSAPRSSFGGFGLSFRIHDDLLIVKDKSGGYTEEEFQYYGLTKDDLNNLSIVNGIEQPLTKCNFPVYRLENNVWKYQIDLYDRLPHPPGGVVRNNFTSTSWAGNRYYSMISFENGIYFSDNKIYLSDTHDFFSFHINTEWDFDSRFEPKFLYFRPVNFLHCNPTGQIDIDEIYSLGRRSDGYLEVYQTANLPKWEPLWTLSFGNDESFAEEKRVYGDEADKYVSRGGDISGNALLLHHNCHDAYVPGHSMSKIPVWSGFYLYEIDESTGPKEVFRLEASNNKNLEVVPLL